MTTPTFGQRIRAHLNAATTTRGGHRPVALPPVTEHEPAPPPGGWGDILARLATANERAEEAEQLLTAAQRRIDELEGDLDRHRRALMDCTAPELRRRLIDKERQLERYRELDIAREQRHGFGYQEGRADAEWPDAGAPTPVEIPSDTPTPPITDQSRPADGGGGSAASATTSRGGTLA